MRKIFLALLIGTVVAVSACQGPDEPPRPGEDCPIKDDQIDSFMPKLNIDKPAEVTIDNRFDKGSWSQHTQITRALDTWNQFGEASINRDLFSYHDGDFGADVVPLSVDDCKFDGDEHRFRIVRVTDDNQWKALGLSRDVPGVTLRCYSNGRLSKQTVMINTNYADPRQFMSIALHELGHAVGLDHSCTFKEGDPNYASCKGLSEFDPYFVAVMYPVFRVSAQGTPGTDIKQSLRRNDMDRAYCLYHGW